MHDACLNLLSHTRNMLQPALAVLPREVWLDIMTICEYEDICRLRMCCRDFIRLADSRALDEVMFRCAKGGATSTPRLHPVLGRFLWTGCPCIDRLLLRAPRNGAPAREPSFECRRHSRSAIVARISTRESQTMLHGDIEGVVALEHAVMKDYAVMPSIRRVNLSSFGPPFQSRRVCCVYRQTGITIGDTVKPS